MKTTLEEMLEFKDLNHVIAQDLARRKGKDYNRDQQEVGDTLFNLRVAELVGFVETAEQGILIRIMDKIMRLFSLTSKAGRVPAVKDESVVDTYRDVYNYSAYVAILYLKRNGRFDEFMTELRDEVRAIETVEGVFFDCGVVAKEDVPDEALPMMGTASDPDGSVRADKDLHTKCSTETTQKPGDAERFCTTHGIYYTPGPA